MNSTACVSHSFAGNTYGLCLWSGRGMGVSGGKIDAGFSLSFLANCSFSLVPLYALLLRKALYWFL